LEIEVRKATFKELVIKLVGEDHTLGNLVAKEALKHPHVKLAAYAIEHPLEGSPIIRIVTDGEVSSTEVFKDILNSLKSEANELLKTLTASLGVKE